MDPAQDPTPGAAQPEMEQDPKGLRQQLGAVRDAIHRLVTAHVSLARTEASEIGAEIGRVAILAGVALGALLLFALLLPIGGLLYLSDWLLGSMGWGVLLGSLALLDVAMVVVLRGVGLPGGRIGRSLLVAFLAGAAVTILLLLSIAGGRASVGLGLFVLFIAWPILAGLDVRRTGIDIDALKARFYPTQTIETTKETIEWVRERTPLGRKS